ncbi:MAG: hypothetical protein ABSD62_10270 [Candidatus Limnocylindrales bacterium]|jgi:H+/Cl- antiporter ClcA
MDRSPIQRGRWIVTVGAMVIVASCLLQWWLLGGGPGELPAQSDIGISDGRGLLLFLAAVATLLLITLPYAAEGPVAIDRPISFVVLLGVAFVAYCLRAISMLQAGLLLYTGQTPPIQPLRGPGFWLAAVGLIIFARGVFEFWEARRRF